MYAARYYAPRYFAPRYFPEVGADSPPAPQPGGGYFVGRYFPPTYFAVRYFPGYTPVTGTPYGDIAWTIPAPTFALAGSSIINGDVAWVLPAPTWSIGSSLAVDIALVQAAPVFALAGSGGPAEMAIAFTIPARTFAATVTVTTTDIWTPVTANTTTWTPV